MLEDKRTADYIKHFIATPLYAHFPTALLICYQLCCSLAHSLKNWQALKISALFSVSKLRSFRVNLVKVTCCHKNYENAVSHFKQCPLGLEKQG